MTVLGRGVPLHAAIWLLPTSVVCPWGSGRPDLDGRLARLCKLQSTLWPKPVKRQRAGLTTPPAADGGTPLPIRDDGLQALARLQTERLFAGVVIIAR